MHICLLSFYYRNNISLNSSRPIHHSVYRSTEGNNDKFSKKNFFGLLEGELASSKRT
nr:MAG TPA: hypothetical protein [Caudoviricetes sp.]